MSSGVLGSKSGYIIVIASKKRVGHGFTSYVENVGPLHVDPEYVTIIVLVCSVQCAACRVP